MNRAVFNKKYFHKSRIVIHFDDFGVNNFVELGRLNYSEAKPPLIKHEHKDILEICYLVRGRQKYIVHNNVIELTGGNIYLTFPNESHGSGQYPEEKSLLYWLLIDLISVSGNFLGIDGEDGHTLHQALTKLKKRHIKPTKKIYHLLDEIIYLYKEDEPFKRLLIQYKLIEFLTVLVESEQESNKKQSTIIDESIEYIKCNITDELSIEQIAERSNLSVSRLRYRFKNETGIPLGEYILREKIEYSRILLDQKKYTITEIAHILEFSSSQYYASVFKRITGETPTNYKNK